MDYRRIGLPGRRLQRLGRSRLGLSIKGEHSWSLAASLGSAAVTVASSERGSGHADSLGLD